MVSSLGKPSPGNTTPDKPKLGLGSSFFAGAIMLSHMNRSDLTRYDDLLADLSRLQSEPAQRTRADRPQRQRPRWIQWIYR
jgi:hypothetical protein